MGPDTAVSESENALLSFSAANVRSYRDNVELSLVASRSAIPGVVQRLRWGSDDRTVPVLPAAGMFGANASGKSAILRAMVDMRTLVLGSFRRGSTSTPIARERFKLNGASGVQPTRFEVDLVLAGVRWQYGFEIDDHTVLAEYALHYPNGRQANVFDREGDRITFGKAFRSDGRLLERLVRPNALLVSAAGAVGRTSLEPLFRWFDANLLLAESNNRDWRALRTADMANSSTTRERVLALLHAADLGITDISRKPVPEELRVHIERALSGNSDDADDEQVHLFIQDRLRLTHCGTEEHAEFDAEDESLGTMVWVGLVGPVLDALDDGSVLLADELDASLHPHLVDQVIALFQDPATNPRCAQLIFNAHDVTVLGDSEIRRLGRDQIWFTEKDTAGATSLYPLADFRPRKDEALERRYLQGRFGALPLLDTGAFARAATLVDS